MNKTGNKLTFSIFIFIIILIVGLLIYALYLVLSSDKKEYSITAGSLLYNKEYAALKTQDKSIVTKKWDDKYYLKETNEVTELGKTAISYDMSDFSLKLFGKIFQVYKDGEVEEKNNLTEVENSNTTVFYKLEDRKYLFVGKQISADKSSLAIDNFVLVVIDEIGNALIINDKLSMKTINPIVLKSGDISFDVANEKLISNSKEIDLKKINGSTNKYKKPEKVEEKEEEKDNQVATPNADTTDTTNNNDTNTIVNKAPLSKRISLRGITPGVTFMDIYYNILDPENKYDSVYLIVSGIVNGVNDTYKIDLVKENTSYRLWNLVENSEYQVSIGYKIVDDQDKEKITESIEDTLNVRTNKNNTSLTISKIKSSQVYFNFKMDPQYVLESGKIKLYIDGTYISSVNIDGTMAVTTDGWNSSLDITNGSVIVLKLEDAVYNGKTVNLNIQAKYVNY